MGILDMLNGNNGNGDGGQTQQTQGAGQGDPNAGQNNVGNNQGDATGSNSSPYDPNAGNNPQTGFPNTQAPQQPQNNPDDPLNVGAILQQNNQNRQGQQGDPNQAFATALISSVMGGNPAEQGPTAPQVKADAFAQAMEQANFTNGIDFGALVQEIQQGENPAEAMQKAFQSVALNTMFAMVPLINQMSTALQDSTLQQALTQVNHGQRSDQIISAFNSTYNYSDNPIVSQMLTSFAKSLADKAPPTASPNDLARALHEMFSGMSGHITQTTNAPKPSQGVTKDFSELFG